MDYRLFSDSAGARGRSRQSLTGSSPEDVHVQDMYVLETPEAPKASEGRAVLF